MILAPAPNAPEPVISPNAPEPVILAPAPVHTAPSSHGEGRSTPGEGDELWVHGKSWRPTRDRAKAVRNETCRGSDLRLYKVRDEKGNSLF